MPKVISKTFQNNWSIGLEVGKQCPKSVVLIAKTDNASFKTNGEKVFEWKLFLHTLAIYSFTYPQQYSFGSSLDSYTIVLRAYIFFVKHLEWHKLNDVSLNGTWILSWYPKKINLAFKCYMLLSHIQQWSFQYQILANVTLRKWYVFNGRHESAKYSRMKSA